MEYTKVPNPNSRRHGNYVARAPPTSKRASIRHVTPIRDLRQQGAKRSSKTTQDKRQGVLDRIAEKSVERTLLQQNRLSCLHTPPRMKSRSSPASPSSQTPSQRRSLTRFTKELERYCMAVSANGKAPLPLYTPTVSESPTTLNTITELLPYHRQFNAAGLAVTSREQMPRIPETIYHQSPAEVTRIGRYTPMARVQIDGSTVTPSEQESVAEDAAAPAVSRKGGGSYTTPAEPQASAKQARPVNKTLLDWLENKDAAAASRTHSGRKFSVDHLHPSQPMVAQPILTPSDKLGIIDSYFNSPTPNKPRDEQPETRKTSSSSSALSIKKGSLVDKPLPKQPPIEQHQIPERSGRRHMENTSQWPTARVLIHDNSPPPLGQHTEKDAEEAVERMEIPVFPFKDPSLSSSSSPTVEEIEATVEHSVTPPAEIIGDMDAEKKPLTPPKDDSGPQPVPITDSRHRRGQSLCKQWSRVTVLRRRSKGRHLPMPTTIQEEPETSPEREKPATTSGQHNEVEYSRAAPQNQAQSQSTSSGPSTHGSEQISDLVPQLPYTWKYAVESSSSFERALDAVIQKLDDMEERRQYEKRLDLETARKIITEQESLKATSSKNSNPTFTSEPPPKAQPSGEPSPLKSKPASEASDSIDYFDNDINDRDILLGLKMAICAACDQDLDAWIREKTGLRLRRFLADLKSFDAVSREGRPSASASGFAPAPQRMHRQIRRNGNEARRLKAERERRGQSMKKALLPCFGADGAPPET